MCGICGFSWDDKQLVKAMMNSLHHRGPDGGGLYTDETVSLGHRRLSIIDLSQAGSQPMGNEKGTLLITYNGEIYNFKELRTILEALGYRFQSNTDTEVLLHGYEQWGTEVVSKLNGMFAFCIYDKGKKSLFLARDRMGVKPLYYYWDRKSFIFASEIKPILLAGVPREVNQQAARNYFHYRYIPGEETLFKGIKKLLPGQMAVYQPHKKELTITSFWDVPLPIEGKMSQHAAAVTVQEILNDSVKRRLVADVPVGVYLSGGIDSAAITALAAKKSDEPVKTFSVGFQENHEADETAKARTIAKHFQTDHHEIIVDEPIAPLLPKLLWHLDMPHGDPVIIPQFLLSRLAAQKVKVVLSGEGADEVFAGYVQYKTFLQAQKAKYIPFASRVARTIPVKQLDHFFDYPESMGEKGKEKVIDFLDDVHPTAESYQHLVSIMSKHDQDFLLQEKFKTLKPAAGSFDASRTPLLNKLLYYDMKRWLPNYVLHINDRLTMANSIEGRTPFLDYRLVEYSMTLPASYKLQGASTKHVLRKAMKGLLPDTSIKKHAFFMPLDKWYKEELKGLAEELFTPAQVKQRGYFNYYSLKKIWERYEKSPLLYGKQLFTIINFELWQRMFIDQKTIPLKAPALKAII